MKQAEDNQNEDRVSGGPQHPTGYASRIGMPYPPDEAIRKVVGDRYDPQNALNVIKMFAGTGDMFAAAMNFVKAVFQAEGIDAKTREVIVLRSAKILNCPYEWQANARMAGNVGLSSREINATSTDGPVTGIDPRYVLLCRATDELSMTATLTDETLTDLMRSYDDETCRKYILIIGWFNLLSRFLNACRVPLETTDKYKGRTSPL